MKIYCAHLRHDWVHSTKYFHYEIVLNILRKSIHSLHVKTNTSLKTFAEKFTFPICGNLWGSLIGVSLFITEECISNWFFFVLGFICSGLNQLGHQQVSCRSSAIPHSLSCKLLSWGQVSWRRFWYIILVCGINWFYHVISVVIFHSWVP